MVSIPKVISVMSCGVLLCLGLSNAAQADNAAVQDEMKADQSDRRQGGQEVGEKQMADEMKGDQSNQEEMKADQSDRRQGGQVIGEKQSSDEMKGGQSQSGKTIKGEVLRVEGNTYFVKGQDGKEVRLRTDHTTQKSGAITQGDRIEATLNEQDLALSIRSAQGRDAGHRNESGRIPDSPIDSGKTSSMGR